MGKDVQLFVDDFVRGALPRVSIENRRADPAAAVQAALSNQLHRGETW